MQHVFISYVRENKKIVSRLYHDLTSHGIDVWLDRNEIHPGVRWKKAIRQAIQSGVFFIACFSVEYNNRDETYMNEELTVATDILRLRSIDKAWFIPIKLNECKIPDRAIGGGDTFKDFQWVELHEDWDPGIQRLLKSISPESSEAEGQLIIGETKAKQGDYEGAINNYDQALRLKPNFPIAYYHRGIAKRDLGQYSEATSDFDQALQQKPDFVDVQVALEETIQIKATEASLRSQNTQTQSEQTASNITPNPVESPGDPGLAYAYYRQGLRKEKIEQHEIEKRERESPFFNSKEIMEQQYKAALADYNKAIRLKPDEVDFYHQRASVNRKLERFEDVVTDYSVLIDLNPNDASLYYERGHAKQRIGQHESAIADYNEAIRLDPNEARCYSQRASIRGQLKQYAAAFVDFDKAIELKPNETDFYYQRISLNRDLGRHEAVIADYSELIRLNPNNDSLYRQRGRANYQLRRYEDAAADWSELIRLNPNNISLYQGRATINEKLERYETLIADYSKVICSNSADATVYQKRGIAYEKLERYEEAKKDYETAKQLADSDALVLIYEIEKSLNEINTRLAEK